MQPRRPHARRAPPPFTTTWPISPAASRPIHGLPSSTMPPPTPVPQNTPSSELYGAADAEGELGVGGHLNVVAERHRRAARLLERGADVEAALPAGQVAGAGDGPGPVVDLAGRADADPVERRRSRPRPGRPPRAAPPRSRRRRRPGRPWSGVGRRDWPATVPSGSTIAAWIFVPPRSMPPVRPMRATNHSDARCSRGPSGALRARQAARAWRARNSRLMIVPVGTFRLAAASL